MIYAKDIMKEPTTKKLDVKIITNNSSNSRLLAESNFYKTPTSYLPNIVCRMTEAMKNHDLKISGGKGFAGLHAIQIGIELNISLIYDTNVKDFMVFVDPYDIKLSGKEEYANEQCFSEVNERGKMLKFSVCRPQYISFKVMENDKEVSYRYEKPKDKHISRVIQHEFDHGKGILLSNNPKAILLAPISKGKSTGRNEKCHCGSGKKFKQCCL